MNIEGIKRLIEYKLKRMEILQGKNFFLQTIGDGREINKLNKEIKSLENKYLKEITK